MKPGEVWRWRNWDRDSVVIDVKSEPQGSVITLLDLPTESLPEYNIRKVWKSDDYVKVFPKPDADEVLRKVRGKIEEIISSHHIDDGTGPLYKIGMVEAAQEIEQILDEAGIEP